MTSHSHQPSASSSHASGGRDVASTTSTLNNLGNPRRWNGQWDKARELSIEMIKHPVVAKALTYLDGLPESRLYHSKEHTTKDVIPNVIFLGLCAGLHKKEILVAVCAAAWHDATFNLLICPTPGSGISVERQAGNLCRKAMEEHNQKNSLFDKKFALNDINHAQDAINNTELIFKFGQNGALLIPPHQGRNPRNIISEILCAADLGNLGRRDFFTCFKKYCWEIANVEAQKTNPQHFTRYDEITLGHLSKNIFFLGHIMRNFYWYTDTDPLLRRFNNRFPANSHLVTAIDDQVRSAALDAELMASCDSVPGVITYRQLASALENPAFVGRYSALKKVLIEPNLRSWKPIIN